MTSESISDARAAVIRRKAFLNRVYRDWYTAISAELPGIEGDALELGSMGSFLSDYIAGLITSDVTGHNPLALLTEAQRLPLTEASLRAIVMTNVLHHIADVRAFFAEAVRCLRPGGRIVMWEPWVTPFSRLIYRHLHHEPFDPAAENWHFPAGDPLNAANGALPWMVFSRDRAEFEASFPALRIICIKPGHPFRYLASGGIAHRALLPAAAYPAVAFVERCLAPLSPWLGLFALIVVERVTPPQAEGL